MNRTSSNHRYNYSLYLLTFSLLLMSCGEVQLEADTNKTTGHADARTTEFPGRNVRLAPSLVAPGLTNVAIDFALPRGYHFVDDSPSQIRWFVNSNDATNYGEPMAEPLEAKVSVFPFALSVEAGEGKSTLIIEAALYYCGDGSKICHRDNVRIIQPIELSPEGSGDLAIIVDVIEPEDVR